ncbi:MAG: MAPEG family protein [Rhodospirillaceae bacterium]|nr:MAPEG family protein [Rhodospirillaceae bacterium]
MIESHPYTAIVLCLGLIVYIWTMLRVGRARAQFKINAPVMTGPVEFERVLRVHGNTLEQLVIFVPALALFAAAWGDSPAALLGVFWPIGRVIYAVRYYAGVNRSLGFGLSFIATMVMLVGALAGAIMKAL